jgi:A/G-specific adenine glycosylase
VDDNVFRTMIMRHFKRHGRHSLPWRKTTDPYRVLVSEVMLQQTQVPRVIEKYRQFLRVFPTFRRLAAASPREVLKVWQGLGYNRRALMLQRCAQVVVREHGGKLPADFDALRALPGIGPYTAGAVLAFAYNMPHPVIETNIRRVYLHHYFPKKKKVPDALLESIVARTLDRKNPRQWYSALMDYGTWLADQVENPNARSKHYTRQSKFEGSLRQLRGQVLALSLSNGSLKEFKHDPRLPGVLAVLKREGFVV